MLRVYVFPSSLDSAGSSAAKLINLRHEPLQICAFFPWRKPLHCARLMEKDRFSTIQTKYQGIQVAKIPMESGTICFNGLWVSMKYCHINTCMYTLTKLSICVVHEDILCPDETMAVCLEVRRPHL